MKSIGAALAETEGVGPGFDTIRLVLALEVIVWHCFPVTNGSPDPPAQGPWWAIVYCIVPMFYALSGFLVTASATRLSLSRFAMSRALRIVPALLVDTVVSILVFGLLFTNLPPAPFLSHPQTIQYWLNCIGYMHYYLPGVFVDNPLRIVNASLWTIPGELCCYVAMGALIASRMTRNLAAPIAAIVLLFAIDLLYRADGHLHPFFLEKQLAGETGKLVCIFLVGSIAYTARYRIPFTPILAALAASYIALSAILGSATLWTDTWFVAGACVALTYLVIWLGLQRLPLPSPFRGGDYSYGAYLYAFPIQQAVVHLTGTREPGVVLVLTIVPVLLLAAFSWHVVEKPALRLRKAFSLSTRREKTRTMVEPGQL